MGKASVIKLPNGTTIEVSSDMSPDQITALITAVTSGGSISPDSNNETPKTGKTIFVERTPEEIWNASKKDRVALFIRNYFNENLWFSSKDIMDQQLAIFNNISLGETSALGTYLNRLFESAYLDRQKSQGKVVYYKIAQKLIDEYPLVAKEQFQELSQVL